LDEVTSIARVNAIDERLMLPPYWNQNHLLNRYVHSQRQTMV
jgi:hypothetical protein